METIKEKNIPLTRKEVQVFSDYFNRFQRKVNETAFNHGFWEGEGATVGEKVALIHSELSKFLEAYRKTTKRNKDNTKFLTDNIDIMDEHCPNFRNIEVELGDAIIRILDLAEAMQLNIFTAMIAKAEYNETRPYKHGKRI